MARLSLLKDNKVRRFNELSDEEKEKAREICNGSCQNLEDAWFPHNSDLIIMLENDTIPCPPPIDDDYSQPELLIECFEREIE